MEPSLETALRAKRRSALPAVLLAAAECAPLSKTGGLADVAGALPKALLALGFDARVITPYHRCAREKYADRVEHLCHFEISLGWRRQYVGLERLQLGALTIYLIDNEYYFGDRIYRGGTQEGEQYCFFQRAVLACIPYLDFQPEILHCNDWHTAMLPFLLKTQYADQPQGRLKTVLSIHNIAFQGRFPLPLVQDLLGVDAAWYRPSAIEHRGCVNFLKAGCVFADRVSTVSPSYAQEIQTPQFGEGLEGVLQSRGGELSGILNGLDTEIFDPMRDPVLAAPYSAVQPQGKQRCRQALLAETGLQCPDDMPILAMVTRMTAQKGFDLVAAGFERLMELGAAFVLLGTGDEDYERRMREAQARWPGRVRVFLTYDEALAHRIYAGADFLLMPSAFEPCGLSQMIAMRYGTLPIVHETGGLQDTVVPYNEFTGLGNGFSFADYSADAMLRVTAYALSCCRDVAVKQRLMRQAMQTDFSFAPSALRYGLLFIGTLETRGIQACHDETDDAFRTPLGAVPCGTRVTLRLRSDCRCALLVADGERLPMRRHGAYFELCFTAPGTPRVVWYHFLLDDCTLLGADGLSSGAVSPFQLTVYDAAFETPDWARGRVMYQIFPDRFRRGGKAFQRGLAEHRAKGRTPEVHEDWEEPVKWQGGESYTPNDFYGGTLAGIEQALPELQALGVGILYLNPVFESCSNHRYDTADYTRIDPMLGTNADFKRLCTRAEALGIRILLDGVFSHTGDDSRYFNRRGTYPEPGAYQSTASPYYSWYDFRKWPDDYRCWWGFQNLPEVNENDAGWQEYMFTGKNSILKRWLRAGAAGYRLDVADELPDGALEQLRKCAKACKHDALLIGEVWEDATTKISYGSRRRYALGSALDSVMNYPLRGAIIDFAVGRADAFGLSRLLLSQKLNYPAPMYHCLMNLLSSHDTARLRTVLGLGGADGEGLTRAQQATLVLSPEQEAAARSAQRLCAAIQFALPGIACIYYGDEEGMQGLRDPFCRASYRRGDAQMREYYAGLARERNASPALRVGDAAFFAPNEDVLCILRFTGEETCLVAVSRAAKPCALRISPSDFRGCAKQLLRALPPIPELLVPARDRLMLRL